MFLDSQNNQFKKKKFKMLTDGSNRGKIDFSEEPFQMEEGLSLNVLNSMMEETLILELQNDSSSQRDPPFSESKNVGIQEENKISILGKKLLTEVNKIQDASFSQAVPLKFMNPELFQYGDLQDLFNKPSSFSFLNLSDLGTVWILQIDSKLAFKFASIFRALRTGFNNEIIFSQHMDGSLFFEIGPFIQSIFKSTYLKFFNQPLDSKIQLRHMFRPAFHREIKKENNILVFQFAEENGSSKDSMRLMFPIEFIKGFNEWKN